MNDFRKAAKELISQMTLEEKVSQMLHNSPAIERLGIPAYNWWNEALHGVARSGTATVFPQAVGMAATFDDELIYEVASVISDEGRAKFHAYQQENDADIYKGLTFWSPNINIFRDPRWGRGHETYGEDPYLTSRLGVKFIKGLQSEDKNSMKSAACAKHFAVHSGPEDLRHEFNAECNSYDLWNTYLPQFEAAVYEGEVAGFMGAYNRTNGEPCCGSKTLLQDILFKKWGFDGYVVSDCWAIKDFHEFHKVTSNAAESVALAVNMGCHLNCGNLYGHCLVAVKEGLLPEEKINEAVEQLFITRMKLGILGSFPQKPEYTNIPYEVVDCAKHKALNLKTSQDGIVMLKNDNVLPLSPEKIKTIGVIGPNANDRMCLIGNYEGTASEYVTVLDGVNEQAKIHDFRVLYAEGSHIHEDRTDGLAMAYNREAEAAAVAKRSDVIIVCLGLNKKYEGEQDDVGAEFSIGDREKLELLPVQQHLLETVVKAAGGKPVILVNIMGSGAAIGWAHENVSAILHGFYPGAEGGRAIAEIIFGKASPGGKLPVTFYKSSSDLPDFENYSMENRTYRYFKGTPLYPFGFGLTYSKFEISNISVSSTEASLTVKNIGGFEAAEVVQIYASHSENQTREIRSLIGFKKIRLGAGGSREIKIPLDKNAFARRDENGDLYKIAGKWSVSVGFSQPDERSAELRGEKPVVVELNI